MPSFNPDFFSNLSRLGLVALLLAVCFVIAARLRNVWGITPIAVLAGLMQVPQTFLALRLSVMVFPGVSVSPGSVVFFPATLFAILLVYVLEDEVEARRLIYGVVLANLTLASLVFVVPPLFDRPDGTNGLGLGAAEAARVAWVLAAGAVLLALDALILIRAFEWFGERVSRNVLARALFALGLSVAFDALAFSPIAFGTRPRFGALLLIAFAGKVIAASFYSLAFMFMLPLSGVPREHPVTKSASGPVTFKDRFLDLQQAAVRDALTGVFNRAYFDHELRVQTDRAMVRGDGLLLLLIDLDSFKKINDTHGHPAGDRVLALFGEVLRAVARQNDTVCRYGGEEFAILIAGSASSIAPRLFERMAEETNRLWAAASPSFPFPAPTFSVGAAAVPTDARSATDLLARADQRLYAAKRAGGNRLTLG